MQHTRHHFTGQVQVGYILATAAQHMTHCLAMPTQCMQQLACCSVTDTAALAHPALLLL